MPDYLVKGVEKATVDALKLRAKQHGRTFQEELRAIFSAAAEEPESLPELELVRQIRVSNTKQNKTNFVDLLREDRER